MAAEDVGGAEGTGAEVGKKTGLFFHPRRILRNSLWCWRNMPVQRGH